MHEQHTGIIQKFYQNQLGGVTVDWVFLAAAVISLSALIMTTIGNGEAKISDNINKALVSSQDTLPQK